ncbi:sulfotransferase 1C4-like isoform X2 [Dreissena polymorpha]|uniref:Sulfotransferase domain-containing protein n=1 Tax=Dreissena polymorpha TaxID=45954 RepID=A0A9D4KYP7_DREPO|nr:sulfotransferase 1C4-like isoform X1 [Dreissena polymorpha]XP_052273967.1 sulfotransferase 1C4-like isoform X2 [Dreissena polymorpha]XP_052273968.1 sulfotransferase 1C4-like isoform X1 [Dreissena polymorpha]XP_052273969.1 sulfotransferase 1C4-like isoform X2 [Dreissena polymorpha]XP_052273970.1 sulfotransferase 1C4-like isoform X1 [Dreissena polymorpha]XP_052273971.1 sulfotransferase 1C4-like isoform X2 [Dreissena polymorpha]KAH3848350.1 hypothetical protein DPMN_090710 [Dreissena polymorp
MTTKMQLVKPDGSILEVQFAKGLHYWADLQLPEGDLAAHIDNVLNFPVREDDIYLATYPKSGTHWVWEIILMLQKRSTDYEKKVKEFAFLDFRDLTTVADLPSPRVLNCHYPCHLTPKEVLSQGIKIVHVQRNFKDVCVSAYHHLKGFGHYTTGAFDEFLPIMLGTYGTYFLCSWCEYVRQWEIFTKAHPDQIINIYFEDLKKDSVHEIRKLNTFLGTGCEEALLEKIALACSFHNLKKADAEFKENPFAKLERFDMYRKGDVGDWKNYFTVAQSEEVDRWISENLPDTQLAFRYSL